MTDGHLLSRGRCSILVSVFTSILALTAVPAVGAQRTPAEIDQAIADLQTRVDALQKDVAISRQLDAVGKDLAELKRTVQDRTPAPAGAWLALGGVGALFIVAWAWVSVLREASRRLETIMTAIVRVRREEPQERVNQQFKDQIEQLQNLLAETAGGTLSLSVLLRRLFKVKREQRSGSGNTP